ncbi:DNA translocase FtsK [Streptomyces sp. NPDC005780]|uniref:DNA translocase FtsK n=1 Tax=Streptomyces sp. NPDC005780 TaxID=3364730 RepID=UPI0036BC7F48
MIDLLYAATELVTSTRHGSPAMLQRRLKNDHGVRVTFKTALSLLDQMHDAGIVGPDRRSTGREVLMESDDAASALRAIHGASWSSAA